MRTRITLVTTLITLGTLTSGCAIVDTVTSADACEKASAVADDMAEVSLLVITNPLGIETYAKQLRESNEELKALNPTEAELASAFDRGTAGLDDLLDAIEDPTSENLARLPDTVAETQLAFLEAEQICKKFRD
jgi:hypothetical protein